MCDSASSVSITNDSMAMTLTTYRCRYQPARSTVVTFVGPLDVTLNGSRCADDFLGAPANVADECPKQWFWEFRFAIFNP
jgi:hypothetical protein